MLSSKRELTCARSSCSNKNNKPHLISLLLLVTLASSLTVDESCQDEVQSTTNQNINISNQQETIKSGNTKTNNFNLQESNYQPTQSTHLIFNVGKQWNKDKLRRSRPPTVDEFKIKQRIIDVYYAALEEIQSGTSSSIHFDHLGRILKALNPKYIATRRVALTAFADPLDPDAESVAPEDELPPPTEELELDHDGHSVSVGLHGQPPQPPQQPPIELGGEMGDSIQDQLDLLSERVRQIATWDRNFIRKLFQVPDSEFSSNQLAYKRLFQCMTYPLFCKQLLVTKKKAAVPAIEAALLPIPSSDSQIEPEPEASEVQTTVVAPGSTPVLKQQQQLQQQQEHQQEEVQQYMPHQRYQPQQLQYQPQIHPWRGAAPSSPPQQQQLQQPTRRFRDQQVNYRVANPDVNLPQQLIQQYAPEYQEQVGRMRKLRGSTGGRHRRHH